MIYDYYEKFSDVHPNIVLKQELNRVGQQFTQKALEAFQKRDDILWKGFHVFSYDMGEPKFYGDKIPVNFNLPNGSAVYERTNPHSPYFIDYRDGKFVITENDDVICDQIYFPTKPKYYDLKLEDGTPLPAIINAQSNMLLVICNKYCEYWNKDQECRYCDINAMLKAQREKETAVARKDPSVLTEAIRIVRSLDPDRVLVYVTGGTILGKYHGQTEVEFYASRLEALREGMNGVWMPACIQIAPHTKEELKRVYDTGVPSIQINLECWGEKMFNWLCPGKASVQGWDAWVDANLKAVEFWGIGRVNPSFVIGIEMAKPNGFTDVKSAVDNLRQGWDFLMKNGVLPRYSCWTIAGQSDLAHVPGQEYPPLEYYIEVEKTYIELRQKYGYEVPFPAAFTFSGHFHSCMHDFEFYHGNGPLSKKAFEERGEPDPYAKKMKENSNLYVC